ncbi:sucrase ferredoxin [Oscillatoria acuminata]|uniref:Sucrase ferredoxin n=1 Tax=Oscillatoria acuminata PCC 6304 TaxID=56110 RepID=K9TJW5_9CYAN|nr:sucrase ferredoxin [Oscillatoria acuminata]AFY82820.1 hypothetical protein Oscil6304_3242 [Oscillatoria acuminata PCC 6304]
MSHISCSELTRQSGNSLSGTALTYENYLLVECPPPWNSYDLETPRIPDNLRAVGNEIYGNKPVKNRILLIYNPLYHQENTLRVLTFRKPGGSVLGYVGQEFFVSDINEVASLAHHCFTSPREKLEKNHLKTRDILICTHGQNDRCCARYGNPLYRQALKIIEDLSLTNLRIWQTSHIGGHRFAPIAVAFPDGRYYGQIDSSALQPLLMQSGSLHDLSRAYRGWGILPKPVQLLEKTLLQEWGWQGLNYKMTGRIVTENPEAFYYRVELEVKREGKVIIYQADVIGDKQTRIELPESCVGNWQETVMNYQVQGIEVIAQQESLSLP